MKLKDYIADLLEEEGMEKNKAEDVAIEIAEVMIKAIKEALDDL